MEFVEIFCVALLHFCVDIVNCIEFNDTRTVHETISKFYMNNGSSLKTIIPVEDQLSTREVLLTIQLYSVDSLDAETGQVDITGGLYLEWTDEAMVPSEGNDDFSMFGSGYAVLLSSDSLWIPPIRLRNGIENVASIGDTSHRLRFHVYDGRIIWHTKIILKANCKSNMRFYPFDKQECSFLFHSREYLKEEIQLNFGQSDWDLCKFNYSGPWFAVSTKTEKIEMDGHSSLKFIVNIEKKSSYFVLNVIFPTLLLSVMNIFTFMLPSKGGSRVTFSLTTLIAFVYMLQAVIRFIPHTADPLPIISFYILILMIFNFLTCVLAVVTLNIYHKSDSNTIPKCVQRCVRTISSVSCQILHRTCKTFDDDSSVSGSDDQTTSPSTLTTSASTGRPISLHGTSHITANHFYMQPHIRTENDDYNRNSQRAVMKWSLVGQMLDKVLFFTLLGIHALFSLIVLTYISARS